MRSNEIIPCTECGEQTIVARPVCGHCESFKGLCQPRQQECPKCGVDCQHTIDQRSYFAYDALEEAALFQKADETRGASRLIGKTIVAVDTSAINVINLTCSDGSTYQIDTVAGPYQIPVVVINKDESQAKKRAVD